MQSGIRSGLPLLMKEPTLSLEEKGQTPAANLVVIQEEGLNKEQFFWTGSIDALSLKSVSTLPVWACLLKLFWYWTMPLAIQNPMSFNTKDAEVVYLAPNTTSLIQPLHQRVIRTFRAHYAQFSMERIVKAIEKNPDRMSLKSGRIIPLRCHHCYKKSHESHESQNNKFVLGNAVSRCCVRLHKIYNRAS